MLFCAVQSSRVLVSGDPIRICELLVGLDQVTITSVVRNYFTGQLRIEIESSTPSPVCRRCGGRCRLKDHNTVELIDLQVFG